MDWLCYVSLAVALYLFVSFVVCAVLYDLSGAAALRPPMLLITGLMWPVWVIRAVLGLR